MAMEWNFDPASDVRVGDTVVWQNTGNLQHSVTGSGFDSGLLDSGARWERRFDEPGVYTYNCTPHPWMKGVVRVAVAEQAPLLAGAPGEQAAGPVDEVSGLAAVTQPGASMFAAETPPSSKFGLALVLAAAMVALTILGAGLPWGPWPENGKGSRVTAAGPTDL